MSSSVSSSSASASATSSASLTAREQILQAAGPIFAEHGFQAATVREICRAAGVNVAAINYYFGDKQRLYQETVHYAYRQRLDQVPVPQWPENAAGEEKLFRFVSALLARMIPAEKTSWHVRLMVREVLHPTEVCGTLVQDYFRPQFEMLLGIVNELVPAEMDEMERRQVAFSIVGQCVYYRVAGHIVDMLVDATQRQEHFSVTALARHITRFSLRALGRREA